jgi:hypothetical protein
MEFPCHQFQRGKLLQWVSQYTMNLFAPNVSSTFCSTLTDSTKHFPSVTDGQSTDQEIIHLIWFWNVHYCVYSSPPLASWIFSASSHIFKTYFSIIAAPTTVCNEDFFFSCFHIKILNVFFIFPCDLITLIVLYCIVYLFSPNIIHMTVDLSVCNIF